VKISDESRLELLQQHSAGVGKAVFKAVLVCFTSIFASVLFQGRGACMILLYQCDRVRRAQVLVARN